MYEAVTGRSAADGELVDFAIEAWWIVKHDDGDGDGEYPSGDGDGEMTFGTVMSTESVRISLHPESGVFECLTPSNLYPEGRPPNPVRTFLHTDTSVSIWSRANMVLEISPRVAYDERQVQLIRFDTERDMALVIDFFGAGAMTSTHMPLLATPSVPDRAHDFPAAYLLDARKLQGTYDVWVQREESGTDGDTLSKGQWWFYAKERCCWTPEHRIKVEKGVVWVWRPNVGRVLQVRTLNLHRL